MDTLIAFDDFTARQAVKELELERERLRTRLGEIKQNLAGTRATFARVLDLLASQRAPLEYEMAALHAKIVSLGGQWKYSDSRWDSQQSLPGEEAALYRTLYRKIAGLLHSQGMFRSPDLLQSAQEALKSQDFLALYHIYRDVLHESRQADPLTTPEVEVNEQAGCMEGKRRSLAMQLRLLRMAIKSVQEQLEGIESHPLYLAWQADVHEQFIEASCDELRRSITFLEWEITELQTNNTNRRGLWIVR